MNRHEPVDFSGRIAIKRSERITVLFLFRMIVLYPIISRLVASNTCTTKAHSEGIAAIAALQGEGGRREGGKYKRRVAKDAKHRWRFAVLRRPTLMRIGRRIVCRP